MFEIENALTLLYLNRDKYKKEFNHILRLLNLNKEKDHSYSEDEFVKTVSKELENMLMKITGKKTSKAVLFEYFRRFLTKLYGYDFTLYELQSIENIHTILIKDLSKYYPAENEEEKDLIEALSVLGRVGEWVLRDQGAQVEDTIRENKDKIIKTVNEGLIKKISYLLPVLYKNRHKEDYRRIIDELKLEKFSSEEEFIKNATDKIRTLLNNVDGTPDFYRYIFSILKGDVPVGKYNPKNRDEELLIDIAKKLSLLKKKREKRQDEGGPRKVLIILIILLLALLLLRLLF